MTNHRTALEARPWLIYSREHNAFWRPNSSGYTWEIAQAGRYTESEARERCQVREHEDGGPGEIMVVAPEALVKAALAEPDEVERFDFAAHLQRQREWSGKTFGPGPRTAGVIDHIRKELREIESEPDDISEWIDVVILALDGAWRAGHSPAQIIAALVAKQTKNEARQWPDWRTMPTDKAIEHDRSA